MSRLVAWTVHLAALASGLTGVAYGVIRFFLEPSDEFSLWNHPSEPLWKTSHILLSPLLLFACGLIWRDHAWERIQDGDEDRRKSGLLLFALLLPMAASGYLLQVSEDEGWRQLWSLSHAGLGLLWTLGYLLHQLLPDD